MWQSSLDDVLNNPPEDTPIMTDSFGNEIYEGEKYYDINSLIVSVDALDSAKVYFSDDDEFVECALCGEEMSEDSDNYYYLINGDVFCECCVKDCEEVATRD